MLDIIISLILLLVGGELTLYGLIIFDKDNGEKYMDIVRVMLLASTILVIISFLLIMYQ
jgi:hypothetical protein